MYGLKNILPKGTIAQANFINLKKRSQQYKKTFLNFIDHFQLISNIYTNYYIAFQENLEILAGDIQKDNSIQRIYKEIINIFKNFNKQLRIFIEKESICEKPMIQIPQIFMADYNLLVDNFQSKAKDYANQQQYLIQMCSKYSKDYKQMFLSIQSYKKSFLDVKLIYNKDQKMKLYNQCTNIYNSLLDGNALIQQKLQEINKHKLSLAESYKTLEKQLTNFAISFAFKYIDQIKKYVYNIIELQRNKLNHMIDRLLFVDKIPPHSFLIMNFNVKYQEYITKQISIQQCKYIPSFLKYSGYLNSDGKIFFKKMILYYFQQITIKTQKRKAINKRFLDYINKYTKTYDKYIIEPYKQLLANSQKIRKKIVHIFGPKWIYFYKIISLIFQNNIENHLRFCTRTENKIKNLESLVQQQHNLLDNYCKQLKNFIQKNISKKIVRKYLNYDQKTQKIQEGPLAQQKQITSQQIIEYSRVLIDLIEKFQENHIKFEQIIKENFTSYMNQIQTAIGQYASYCNELRNNHYEEANYSTHYKLCQSQTDQYVKKQMKFFQENNFGILLKQSNKITFDGEINKLQGFKKLKKPKQFEQHLKDGSKLMLTMSFENSGQNSGEVIGSQKEIIQQQQKMKKQDDKTKRQEQKRIFLGEIVSKNAEFIFSKISLHPNEKYVKSYACALSDNLLLSGRLYITSHRLFFYSKFNRNTLFFGETFIEIPKNDIKKIQKRNMSFFFSNALSITTVNGELLFVSLMSRDQTYDYIRSTFQINSQQIYFQQQNDQDDIYPQMNIQFQDDMKEEVGIQRQAHLSKKISLFQYQTAFQGEFQFPDINVVKFLKIFELDQEININRTNYPSFLYYIKDKQQHKNINIEPWNPNPFDYCNLTNIKEDSPQVYYKKVVADVPLPASNIPFMPKSALTSEDHYLYIINKNKYIIEVIVKTTGIPYSDAYELRLRKTVFFVQQNKVKMIVQVFVNFNQKVMVKSTIQNKAYQGSKQNYHRIGQQIKAYLKILQKKMQKNSKKQTPEDKLKQYAEQVCQMQKEIKQSNQVKKELENQLNLQKQTVKMKNIIIIALIVIIFIQFLIICT